jgi:hypothetical protein
MTTVTKEGRSTLTVIPTRLAAAEKAYPGYEAWAATLRG